MGGREDYRGGKPGFGGADAREHGSGAGEEGGAGEGERGKKVRREVYCTGAEGQSATWHSATDSYTTAEIPSPMH